MFTIVKPSEIDTVLGTEVGVSDWVTIDQDRINKFADATMDHQFIHVDPEQATPVFGSTIAHGFLSLSMVAGIPFEQEIGMVLDGTKMGFGVKRVADNGLVLKLDVSETAYDAVSFTTSNNTTATADLDNTAIALSIGKQF